MIAKTEGIVLKTFDFRETSRIATFFTRDYGKLKGILKGIRKDSRKFGSYVDRCSVNDIVFYHYRNSDLHLISQCDLKEYFLPIQQEYKRSLAAHYALELINILMPAEEANSIIYQLILDYLRSLQTQKDIDKLVYLFQIKILQSSGFRPYLDSCLKCQKKVVSKAKFSLRSGGLLCQSCLSLSGEAMAISQGTIASIVHIEKNTWPEAIRLGLTSTVKKELKYILNNFLVYHLEKSLKTSRYL